MRGTALTETQIAEPVVSMLEREAWDVYQEVQCHAYRGRADIVALSGGRSWIVEVKRCATLAVLEQAVEWLGAANWISVACGTSPRGQIFKDFCRWKGIGLMTVYYDEVHEEVAPKLWRLDHKHRPIAEACGPEHKTFAKAGTNGGGYWTPFNQTCRNLRDYVVTRPGCTMKEAVAAIRHHYLTPSTARASLRKWIASGMVKGVRLDTSERHFRLFPEAPK